MTSTKWAELSLHPAGYPFVPTGIDRNNYISIDYNPRLNKINCIYKYNIDTNEWTKIDGFNVENISNFSAALDVQRQVLFLSHRNNVTQIQLNNNAISNHHHNRAFNLRIGSLKSIIINNSLFIIGGENNNSILKWDSENKTFTKFSDMYNKTNISDFGMIYNHKNNSLLTFGGCDWDNNTYLDCILEFNIKTKQWNKLAISLPKPMSSMSCTMGINNKYVLLFGGYDENWNSSDDIYIYSVKHKTIKQSKIKCPAKSAFCKCITVNDNIKDEKLVFGYVRKQWEICNISQHYFPYYLLKLMHSYYLNEFVYLLDTLNKKHYKIDILDIIYCD